jgi:hypothetical protein
MRSSARAGLVAAAALIVMAAPALATNTEAIHGKVLGQFASASGCFGCGALVKYVRADRVWCGWQGDNVIIHVRFRNSSVERLTIHWHPSYVIRGGGAHGEGFGSIQDHGVDAHASRGVYVKQQPKGVAAGSPIAKCKPSYYSVESG